MDVVGRGYTLTDIEPLLILLALPAGVLVLAAVALLVGRFAHRRGWWWLPAAAVWAFVRFAAPALGDDSALVLARVVGCLALAAAAAGWWQARSGANGLLSFVLALVAAAAGAVRVAPDGFGGLASVTAALALGAANFAAARAAGESAPVVRALYLGLLGLLGAAGVVLLPPFGHGFLTLGLAILWLPPLIDTRFVAGDRTFGADAYGARCTGLLLLVLLGTVAAVA